jgi:hypothetical protein
MTIDPVQTVLGDSWGTPDPCHFTYLGRQVRSLLSLISYLGGEYCDRYLGTKIPPTNLQREHRDQAREFAAELATGVAPAARPQK